MGKSPFIHLFETRLNKYFYDVNKDQIVKVTDALYECLANQNEVAEKDSFFEEYRILCQQGYLSSNRVLHTKHPQTEEVSFYLQSKINFLELQVTQRCNLRCKYCAYSGNYYNREHSDKNMNFETAKKAIDFVLAHSTECDEIIVGFYGGEPLVNFPLIKQCVEYLEKENEGRNTCYTITTNGTLLNKSNIEFLVKYDFNLTFSIDGPEEIHDVSRRYAGNNKGSFQDMFSNLGYINRTYPDFFLKKVSVSTVIDSQKEFKLVSEFFKEEPLLNSIHISAGGIVQEGIKSERTVCDSFIADIRYEEFLRMLGVAEIIDENKISPLLKTNFELLDLARVDIKKGTRESLPGEWHHSGPCIPGVKKIFVTADGQFYPCEKVSETATEAKIGDVDNGISIEKVIELMNIEKHTEKKCHDCWVYSHCNLCATCIGGASKNVCQNIISNCENAKRSFEDTLKDICVLEEISG